MKVVITARDRDGHIVAREIERLANTAEEKSELVECFHNTLIHDAGVDTIIVRIEMRDNG